MIFAQRLCVGLIFLPTVPANRKKTDANAGKAVDFLIDL